MIEGAIQTLCGSRPNLIASGHIFLDELRQRGFAYDYCGACLRRAAALAAVG